MVPLAWDKTVPLEGAWPPEKCGASGVLCLHLGGTGRKRGLRAVGAAPVLDRGPAVVCRPMQKRARCHVQAVAGRVGAPVPGARAAPRGRSVPRPGPVRLRGLHLSRERAGRVLRAAV